MNIRINLDKEAAQAYKEFCDHVKPESISLDDFSKSLFILGVKTIQQQLAESLEKMKKDSPEEFNKLIQESRDTTVSSL